MSTKAASLLLAVIFLSGCESRYPTDLSVISVQAVNYRDQSELDLVHDLSISYGMNLKYHEELAKENTGNAEAVNEPYVDRYHAKMLNDKEWQETKLNWLLLKIEFQSDENLHEYRVANGYNLRAQFSLCRRQEGAGSLRQPVDVFWRSYNVSRMLNVPVQPEGDTKSITYYAFAWAINKKDNPVIVSYDLRRTPEDICFQVEGRSPYSFYKYNSNVVVIPRQTIAEALQLLPQPFDTYPRPDVPGSE